MFYDIAIKRLMEIGGASILREVAHMEVREINPLEELPQEQVALCRNDYAARCVLPDGREVIVLVEFQTYWEQGKLLTMVLYAVHRMIKHDLPVAQIMIPFHPSELAQSSFTRDGLSYSFHLIKLWELDTALFLNPETPALWPLAALAREGLASVSKVDKMLHEAALPRQERSDLLTIFAIFVGLRDKTLAQQFINKRREIMIESPVYDMIKDEGREEGSLRATYGNITEALLIRFGSELNEASSRRLLQIRDVSDMQMLFRKAMQCSSIAEFEQALLA